MVSYVILAGIFLTLGGTGLFYMFMSDVLDIVEPISRSLPEGHSNPDTDLVGDMMLLGARLSPVWMFIGVILYAYSRAQKPESPY